MHGGHDHIVVRDGTHDGLLPAIRLRTEGCAFEHLAEIVSLVGGETMMQRRRCKYGGVRAAPTDDHVGPLPQQLNERVNACHRDYSISSLELGLREIGKAIESEDAAARSNLRKHVLLAHLRVEVA